LSKYILLDDADPRVLNTFPDCYDPACLDCDSLPDSATDLPFKVYNRERQAQQSNNLIVNNIKCDVITCTDDLLYSKVDNSVQCNLDVEVQEFLNWCDETWSNVGCAPIQPVLRPPSTYDNPHYRLVEMRSVRTQVRPEVHSVTVSTDTCIIQDRAVNTEPQNQRTVQIQAGPLIQRCNKHVTARPQFFRGCAWSMPLQTDPMLGMQHASTDTGEDDLDVNLICNIESDSDCSYDSDDNSHHQESQHNSELSIPFLEEPFSDGFESQSFALQQHLIRALGSLESDALMLKYQRILSITCEFLPTFSEHENVLKPLRKAFEQFFNIITAPSDDLLILFHDFLNYCNSSGNYLSSESVHFLGIDAHINSLSTDLDESNSQIVEDPHCVDIDFRDKHLAVLESEFSDVFSGKLSLVVKHDITMSIKLNGDYRRPYVYRIPYAYRSAAKDVIDDLLSKGIIQPSNSSFRNPITCVKKKNGDVRLCGDFRALNAVTKTDAYTLPRIDDIKNSIRGRVFSTLDLKDGFFQIPMNADSREYTAIETPWGLFEYVRMPFGLKNAPSTFQRFVDRVLHGLSNFALVYIDDVIVFSQSLEEHYEHLRTVFSRLSLYGLVTQKAKCEFFTAQVKYLGLEFTPSGYCPPRLVVPKMESFPVPGSKKDVQKFLGAIGYYRSHIPHLGKIAAPIYDLLKSQNRFKWTEDCQVAFDKLRSLLQLRIPLVAFTGEGDIVLQTDASQIAVGAVLLQNGDPVEFFSKKFLPAEQRYPTYEREAAGMVFSMVHFKPLLIGHYFRLQTDHKPLLAWKNRPPATERQARLMTKIQDLNFDIEYLEGEKNVLADLMSRPFDETKAPLEDVLHSFQLHGLKAEFISEDFIAKQKQEYKDSSFRHKDSIKEIGNLLYLVDEANTPKLLVPKDFTDMIIDCVHQIGHPGRLRTTKLLQQHYFWPTLSRDVVRVIKHCVPCQMNKVTKKSKRTPLSFYATQRFQIVHIDIVGPLKTSRYKNKYILTMLDRYSRWFECTPLRTITAENVAEKFVSIWISRFGVPEIIISDQGTQFESQVFAQMCTVLGVKRSRTTPYHPQSNGMLERAHSTLKNSLRSLTHGQYDWEQKLPLALLAMRSAVNPSGLSAAQILYGENVAVPGLWFEHPVSVSTTDITVFALSLTERMSEIHSHLLQAIPAKEVPRTSDIEQPNLFPYEFAFVRQPFIVGSLMPKYTGPYKVLATNGPVITLDINNEAQNLNVDRLKPAYGAKPQEIQQETEEAPQIRLPPGVPADILLNQPQVVLTPLVCQAFAGLK